jgi:hypothetical protein
VGEVVDERGLSFVYVDDEEDEDEDGKDDKDETTKFPLDKFFYKLKDANSLLSSLIYDDDSAARYKEILRQVIRGFHIARAEKTA